MTLQEVVSQIKPADQGAMAAARAHWDTVAHPLNSLGLLGDSATRVAGARGTARVGIS